MRLHPPLLSVFIVLLLASPELPAEVFRFSADRKTGSRAKGRELIVLENGGILIDNPGMREVGSPDSDGGIEKTFDSIVSLSQQCKFKDCTHTTEVGCSVIDAVESGEIDKESYQNYLKMEREKAHFESTIEEKRKKDKDFGKILKNYKKDIKKLNK